MRLSYVILAALVVGGCGGGEAPSQTRQSDDPLTDTIDRASGVEATLQDAAAERRRQIESQE